MSGGPPPTESPDDIAIAPAEPDDRLDILRVLDAAMLETDPGVVDAAIDAGEALLARFTRTGAVVGALVPTRPEPDRLHVDAVAVRRARRGRGIGTALVAAAVRRAERDPDLAVVTAAFDADLRAFYAGLGFAVRPAGRPNERGDADATDAADEDRVEERNRVPERTPDRLWGRVAVDGSSP